MPPTNRRNRIGLTLAVAVASLLVFGAVILQQINYKAEQTYASIYLSPLSFRSIVGQEVTIDVKATFNQPTALTAVEYELPIPEATDFVAFQPASSWRTISAKASTEVFKGYFAPALEQGAILTVQGEVALGRITLKAKSTGYATVMLERSGTSLVAADLEKGNHLYDAIESLQGSAGTIAANDEAAIKFPEVDATDQPEEATDSRLKFQTERITGIEAVPTSQGALLFVSLSHPGRISVEFGQTQDLGSTVQGEHLATQQVIQLSGLESSAKYYYRLVAAIGSDNSRLTSSLKTFSTLSLGKGVVERNKTGIFVSPSKANATATLYVVPTNSSGQVEGATISTKLITGSATISPLYEAGGLLTATVKSTSKSKQVVRVGVLADGVELGSRAVVFDPKYQEPQLEAKAATLGWTTSVMATLVISLVGLALFSLLFIRLAKGR